jgi:hypothetical protein
MRHTVGTDAMGALMTKRLTPIERAIAGEPTDRRKRYEAKMRRNGFVRATFIAPPETLELIKELARLLRQDPDAGAKALQELRELLTAPTGGTERPQRSEDAPRPLRAPETASR